MFDDVLKHRSGRVIALARAVMAAVFLLAIWVDPAQPALAVRPTYALLGAYLALAIGITAVTWNNWWLDARLAAPAHFVDILMFTILVLASDGYTSPFFVFFVFLILSAAIRWGWRETALTAGAVTLMFVMAGLAAGASQDTHLDLQRFIIRSGNLVVLSGILIWFGINQGFSTLGSLKDDLLGDLSPDETALESAISRAARRTSAKSALLIWRWSDSGEGTILHLAHGKIATVALQAPPKRTPSQTFLFDAVRNRAFTRSPDRRMQFSTADRFVDIGLATSFDMDEGLGIPIRTDAGRGLLLLCTIKALCTDHVEFGDALARAVSTHIQRHALLVAEKAGAGARARLSLARDLHDSIVQFLAGATFRIEAIKRSMKNGDRPERELQDLKELLLQEQQELRSAIGALRSDVIMLPRLAADLESLCERLARQWDIRCHFRADVPNQLVPMRLHLDAHQLIRESVANAVRHAKAKRIDVDVSADEENLRLDIGNDGTRNVRLKEGSPWSLRERVDEADGTLMLASRETGTSVTITLPLKPEVRP